MKNKFLNTLIIAAVLSSCKNDFLRLAPQTSLSAGSFFKNAEEYNQVLTGAYANLRGIAFMGAYMDEMRSDNTFFTFYSSDRGSGPTEDIIVFLDDNSTSQKGNSPGDRYGNDYSGISTANTVLSRIGSSSLAQADKDQITGEALFLRAFYYYDLVQHYGGVPLQLREVTDANIDDAFLPRNTVAEVYAQIIADLTVATPLLSVANTFPQSGRASKGAAKMLLAYAYMSKPAPEYPKAEAALLDITKMNYKLLDDYASVFDPSNKNNQESIFEIQYQAGNQGQQSDFIWRFIPKTKQSELILGLHGVNARGSLSSGGWNVPTQEMVDSYEAGDKRLPASIAVAEGRINSTDGVLETVTAVKSPVGYVPHSSAGFYYFIKKYLHPPYSIPFNTNDNWPVFRYSGALLLLAECLVAEGKIGEALIYLNRVRERAGLPPLAQATKLNVSNEMRHELAFENHRWTDLIRNGYAIEAIKTKGATMKRLYGWLLEASFNVTKEKLIYPIPLREIQLNNKLVQNPGY